MRSRLPEDSHSLSNSAPIRPAALHRRWHAPFRRQGGKRTASRHAGEARWSLGRWALLLPSMAVLFSLTIPLWALEGPPISSASVPLGSGTMSRAVPERSASGSGGTVHSSLPVSLSTDFFTENAGQIENRDVRFYLSSGRLQVGLTDDAVLLKVVEGVPEITGSLSGTRQNATTLPDAGARVRGVLVRMTFEGANVVEPRGSGELPHRGHFFLGNDPSKWRTNVRSYNEVVYGGLYEGIDLVYRAAGMSVKYEFLVQPGADPGRIEVSYEGIEGLDLDAEGNLIVHTVLRDLGESVPYSHQGSGEEVVCSFALRGPLSYGFDCEGWDRSRPLVIDPLVYSTFLGGSSSDNSLAIVVDSGGNAYVTGRTWSVDFPHTIGPQELSSWGDFFVTKLNPAGDGLVYSTFFGGSESEEGMSIALDQAGNAYVTGYTASEDFPTTPGAYDTSCSGGRCGGYVCDDAFVTKLDANGALVYSTCLGGRRNDYGHGVTLDPDGNAYVTGYTTSNDFPTTAGAFDTTANGGGDGFLTKLDANGSALLYSTYLGGKKNDSGREIVLNGSDAYVAGWTASSDFPTTASAYDTSYNGGIEDGFVTQINATGSDIVYSTYFGGSGREGAAFIALDSTGNAYLTGWVDSTDFPTTTGAFDTSFNGGTYDAFVMKLNAAGSALLYSTYLGGSASDDPVESAIAVDSAGIAHVTGPTESGDFPTTPGAFDTSHNGSWDAFVAKLEPAGNGSADLLYSTFLGDAKSDHGQGLALDSDGGAYVSGKTYSPDFPTTAGAYDVTCNGGLDAFVTKLAFEMGCAVDSDCDDANDCTTDACIGEICEYTPLPDVTSCSGGICCGGTCTAPCVGDADCDDDDICTNDTCQFPGSCSAFCENLPNNDPSCCDPTHSNEKGPRCSDGLDNDCDGLIDCDDPDCKC